MRCVRSINVGCADPIASRLAPTGVVVAGKAAPTLVGAGLPAMVVNDDAGIQDERSLRPPIQGNL